MTTQRLAPAERTSQLLDVAVKLARKHGLDSVTREMVATAAGVSEGLVSWRFGGMVKMRSEIVRAAVEREILPIIAQGLMMGETCARRAPIALRQRAMESLIK